MRYEVVFLNTFLKQFKKLPGNVWKDRVGAYRIIYKIEDEARRVIFYDVDLRKRIYD